MRSRVLVAGAVLLLSAACSSTAQDDVEPGGDTPTITTSTSNSGSGSSPEAPSESLSESPPASVEPATGPELVVPDFDVDVISFRLPKGRWRITGDGRSATQFTAEGVINVGGTASTGDAARGLGPYARSALDLYVADRREPQRVDDREVQGVEGFVLEGSDASGFLYVFGAVYGESLVVLTFEFPQDTPESRDAIESVFASAEWL